MESITSLGSVLTNEQRLNLEEVVRSVGEDPIDFNQATQDIKGSTSTTDPFEEHDSQELEKISLLFQDIKTRQEVIIGEVTIVSEDPEAAEKLARILAEDANKSTANIRSITPMINDDYISDVLTAEDEGIQTGRIKEVEDEFDLTNLFSKMDSTDNISVEETMHGFPALHEDPSKKIENQTSAISIENGNKNRDISTDKEKNKTLVGHEQMLGQEDISFAVNLDAGAASKDKIVHSKYQACNEIVTEWKQDAKAWELCIARNDKREAQRLIFGRILPDHKMLNKTSKAFESDPQILKVICDEINAYFKTESDKIIDVYAGFEQTDDTLVEEVVFAVITTSKITIINKFGYKIEQICIHEVNSSHENKDIKIKEQEYPINEEDIIKAETVMTRHSQRLMKMHKNITRISVSWIKSTKFGTEEASMSNEVCVTLYVPRKGLIPIEEKPFPKILDGVSVDVREGVCVPYLGSNDVHESIKIGCAISGHTTSGQYFSGTLGGFFEKENQVYGLTCAHVFLQNPNLKGLESKGTWDASDTHDPSNYVYQPTPNTKPFGSLVRAVFTKGDDTTSGVDAALFHIKERHPKSGIFPDAANDREAGFDEENPMIYNSGKLSQKVKREALVVKHGISTGITKGSFRTRGGAVRMNTAQLWGFELYKQYEIESFGDTIFANIGDSGAMVFSLVENELIGIGIVEAGMGSVCFVTPIYDVFNALCIPPPFEMKRFILCDNTSIVCSGGSVVSKQEESTRLENADEIKVKVDNNDPALSHDITKQMEEVKTYIHQQLSEFKTEILEQNRQLCADFDQKITRLEEKIRFIQTESRDEMQTMMEQTLEKKMEQVFENFMGKINHK